MNEASFERALTPVRAQETDLAMRIRYENSIEDLVAFNRYHCNHSPTVRRARLLAMCFWMAVALGAGAAVALIAKEPVVGAAGVIGAVVGLLLTPGAFRRQTDRAVRRLLKEGANKAVLGSHELELVGDELVERTPFGETRMRIEAVERVVSDGGYTFIYVSAVGAHVIPHSAVSEGDPAAFVKTLRQRMFAELV
jgi:hypothetical protein